VELVKPAFAALGLELNQFVVENISLPEELAKVLDQRIGMSMVGDVGRYTQYAAAESLDLAAARTPAEARGWAWVLARARLWRRFWRLRSSSRLRRLACRR
jgi:membrane protease subunit (stomatin/prohibitin family)